MNKFDLYPPSIYSKFVLYRMRDAVFYRSVNLFSVFTNKILHATMQCMQLAFLTQCDQDFNPPFLGGKIIELAKFCLMNGVRKANSLNIYKIATKTDLSRC